MSHFKTPKGTDLPFLNLKGKDYLQVMHRLVWFREECPDWGIQTEYLQISEKVAIAKATIRDRDGYIIAQATKSETPAGFGDFIEKAESGAVGRALGFAGFGTQFAQELEEGERIVDSPAPSRGDELPKFPPPQQIRPPVAGAQGLCPTCHGKMMLSKYENKLTGAIDYYCSKCKISVPKTA